MSNHRWERTSLSHFSTTSWRAFAAKYALSLSSDSNSTIALMKPSLSSSSAGVFLPSQANFTKRKENVGETVLAGLPDDFGQHRTVNETLKRMLEDDTK